MEGCVKEKNEKRLTNLYVYFKLYLISNEIAFRGGLYRRDYFKSDNVGLADAIIAATSDIKNASLVTLNQKHFPMLTNVIIPYRKS